MRNDRVLMIGTRQSLCPAAFDVQGETGSMQIRLATRGSVLALTQANMVKAALEAEGATVEIVEVTTKGDMDREHPLVQIGGKGLFVRGIEEAILRGEADIAVHSSKDLPYELTDELVIGGVPEAAAATDLLILRREAAGTAARNANASLVIGTGSPRRIMECRRYYPNAQFKDIRGNITTRLRKLAAGEYDAIVMAKAGVDRIHADLSAFVVREFSAEEFVPACCQGILAVECRESDIAIREMLERISDPVSRQRFDAERDLFCRMQADCTMAVGVHAQIAGDRIRMRAMLDGRIAEAEGLYADYTHLNEWIIRELGHS